MRQVLIQGLLIAGITITAVAIAQQAGVAQTLAVSADEIKYGQFPGAPPGVTSAVVLGDPSKSGIYVLRNKFPPNSRLLPHSHSDNWRVMTVLEGAIWFGYGTTLEESKLKRLGPGSVISEPKDSPHFFITKEEGALLQIVAEGPFNTTYFNPPPSAR